MSSLEEIELSLIKKYAKRIKPEALDIWLRANAPHGDTPHGLCHMAKLEALARAVGYQSLRELQALASGKGTSQIFPPQFVEGIPFRFRVGSVHWSVEAREHGPVLRLTSSFPDQELREIRLGLGPVIRRKDAIFELTMYGQTVIVPLKFYKPHEVFELARLVGIPVYDDDFRAEHQQIDSEATFLEGTAFEYIRRWVRHGGNTRVGPTHWNYYLSPVWVILVALSDAEFGEGRLAVVDKLLRKGPAREIGQAIKAIENVWLDMPTDGSRLSANFEAVLPKLS